MGVCTVPVERQSAAGERYLAPCDRASVTVGYYDGAYRALCEEHERAAAEPSEKE